LPKAHPVAPTPASALLSGILIKIGAYGLLRTMLNYAFPESVGVSGAWDFASGLGYAMIWLGLITMFVGAFLALLQFNAKKLLAYSSISQMGYILLGIGLMSYMGVQGSMAYAGTLYHIINHALFKSVLFMVVGVIYLSIHELDMRKMGGLYRRLPITAGIALIASMAIAGIPLANGFISKTLIHHALEKAIVYGHPTLILVEWLFILVSAGTVAYFIKFYRYIFLGYIRKEHIACAQSTKIMELAMGGIVLAILVIGLRPHWLLDYLIVPTLYQRNFDLAFIEKYVLPLNFFAREDLHLMLQISALGSLIYLIMERYQLFNVNFKMSFTVEKILMYPINKTLQYYIQLRGKRLVDYWNAYNPYIEDKSMSALKQQGILGRIFTMSNLFTRLHENDLIRNDAFIYAVILTLIVSFLLLII
jgi:hydrogenase-4 component B